MDQGYVRQLIKGHRIEVNGEATYAAAARRTADAEQRAKWCTLEWLESQTKRELAGLTAHEQAQCDFARRELRGDAGSLEPVRALLRT